MKNQKQTLSAVVDNWFLEIFTELLDSGIPKDDHLNYKSDFFPQCKEMLCSLFQLIDLLILYDDIIYDRNYSFRWNTPKLPDTPKPEAVKCLSQLLSPIDLDKNERVELGEESESPEGFSFSPMHPNLLRYNAIHGIRQAVVNGATYYLNLARALGASYWPSSHRAEYLLQLKPSAMENGFIFGFRDLYSEKISEILDAALAKIPFVKSFLSFPGFSSAVLALCSDRTKILPTIIQYRDSEECKEFRKWLYKIDAALEIGNIEVIVKGLRELDDVVEFVRRKIGLSDKGEESVKLTVGLSPAFDIDSKSIKQFIANFRRKPHHITFLRNHLLLNLRNININTHLTRLFPEATEAVQKRLILDAGNRKTLAGNWH